MTSINYTCVGESHIETGKPCQDNSFSEVFIDGISVAIVSDGHGGKRYFRSDVGSKIATGVALDKIKSFISYFGDYHLKRAPFIQRTAIKTQIEDQDFNPQNEIDKAFRQLFSSIIFEWNQRVQMHASQHPLSEKEKAGMEEEWISEFENNEKLEKVYGCTLIAAAFTPKYWFAFQIGDGKCFSIDETGEWSEPIPWDDRCFLNRTTSICDSDALNEFRYCYEGNGKIPVSIILASDGLDDSFGNEENQENFYVQILKSIIKKGKFLTEKEIHETLPQLSKKGSQDDMSIAMIYNEKKLWNMYKVLINWQIQNTKRHIEEQNLKIQDSLKTQQQLENLSSPTKQNLIDLQYAKTDENRASEEISRLNKRLCSLHDELKK